tara:strand:+ start:198 stop:434 length:237 start_codon:yes stop_codon:yes gene_type:complete
MKAILIISILIISFASPSYSYPESQIEDCVSSALSNPATKSIPEYSIKKYCDCALIAIIDEKRELREAGYQCAMKYFN